ncbi:hypothetical protein [Thalassorhabdomicrobium marinisediminis]|uniref:DUF2029 domain-containing protein n=1 Tax=Thalassorhabdomicrobium marinisediminis TaxID=2170577 RepID=A0A2T7FUG5_9RHOB|nr:hypothetical protein [Thalassorhabdomicrobium marinisediminis]PVA05798.1 hypothetical protein DC363_13320 [Thalassorhabdomicrobium marinisediminis]
MTRKSWAVLAAFLTLTWLVLGGAAVLSDGLYVGKHEGDTLHVIQIVLRMAQGQLPHLDFMTPIGLLAFWPIAMLVKAGLGVGTAFLWTQVLVAAVFLPMIIRIAGSRLGLWLAALFGFIVLVLLLALVHGEAEQSISISMHYNRLAWAAAFVAILAAMIPPETSRDPRRAGAIDGVIIGLMVFIMAMTKMTYFATFIIPIVVALALTRQRRAIGVALVTGLVLALGVTIFTGVDFWTAYLGDLLEVAGSVVRPAPGAPLSAVMAAPAYLAGSLVAVAGVIFLRLAHARAGGMVLLMLLPGFIYVTYQNFGNDPQWLLLLGVLLLGLRGQADNVISRWGWSYRDALVLASAVAFALSSASLFNLMSSPLRHLQVDPVDYVPMLPRGGVHRDLLGHEARQERVDARIALDIELDLLPRFEGRDPDTVFLGETSAPCALELGLPGMFGAIVRDLEQAGLADGASLFAADIFSSHWLFGDLDPLDQGAPWYYGGLPGIEDADYLLVPRCPVIESARQMILELIEERIETGTLTVSEVRRTPLYVLYALD